MNHARTLRHLALVFSLLLATATAVAAQTQQYTVIDLGVLPGAGAAGANDINNANEVVGSSGGTPFVWRPGSGMQPLGSISVGSTYDMRINDSGVIVGTRSDSGNSRPVMWAGGTMVDLPAPAASTSIEEFTDGGLLLYRSDFRSSVLANGELYDLGSLLGIDPLYITGLNDQLMLGGSGRRGGGLNDTILRLPDGSIVDPAPNVPFGPDVVTATGPHLGKVGPEGHYVGTVGRFRANATEWETTLFHGRAGQPGTIAATLTDAQSVAFSKVNRRGDSVGAVFYRNAVSRGFLLRDGVLTDLTSVVTPGWHIRYARAINDAGYIVGWGTYDGSGLRAVLLVPPGAEIPGTGTAPQAPTGLSYSLNGAVLTVTWQGSSGATEYVLEAGSATGGTDLFSGSIGGATSISAPVGAGTYYIRVRARNTAGTSPASTEIVVRVP
ncbi:MAG: hypothetical protein AB7O67_09900 [Vicinamibacterales bacterium]